MEQCIGNTQEETLTSSHDVPWDEPIVDLPVVHIFTKTVHVLIASAVGTAVLVIDCKEGGGLCVDGV